MSAITSWHCAECGHCHTPVGCIGDPTPSDIWAGVTPSACDCDEPHALARTWSGTDSASNQDHDEGEA